MTDPSSPGALLRRTVRRHLPRLVPFVVLLTLWQVCETAVPVIVGQVIDRAVVTGDVSALVAWLGVLVAVFAVLSASYRFGARFGFGAAQEEMHLIRMEVLARALEPSSSSRHRAGEVLALSSGDAANIGFALRALGYSAAATGSLAFSAVVLIRIDLALGLLVIVGTAVVLLAVRALTPVLARRTREQEDRASAAIGAASDLLSGLRVLHGLGAGREAARRYRRTSRGAADAAVAAAGSYGSVLATTAAASGLLGVVIAVVAARMAVAGQITIGELVSVVGLSQFLVEPLGMLGSISAQFAQARGSATRVVDFLADTRPQPRAHVVPDAGAALSVAMGESTLVARRGELLGVCVPDHAQAVGLVRQLADAEPGVRWGDHDLSEVDPAVRPAHLVVAPHRVDLFEGTVGQTLAVGAGGPSPEVALAAAAASDLLEAEGLDTTVSADGTTLSGGQRQRLSLARALACGTSTLVLHDPTTALDPVTESRVADGIVSARHAEGSPASTWLVTSSPTLLERADRVVLLRDGRVLAEGTHSALLQHSDYAQAVLR